MSPVDYRRVADLDEALELLHRYGEDAKILAGGQSLIPMMSAGLLSPELLIDINHIAGLDSVSKSAEGVRVGALVRHRTLEVPSEDVPSGIPLLRPAARLIGHSAIRNRGTLVGSIVHADPSAEWPAVAVALDAQVQLLHSAGERTVPIADFLLAPMTSAIEAHELAAAVLFPASPPATGVSVQELVYRHGDYAIVGVVAQVTLAPESEVVDARLALFGVDAVPVRASEAEAAIGEGGLEAFEEAAHLAPSAANPTADATASAAYRREMIPVFCLRALAEAYIDARAALTAAMA